MSKEKLSTIEKLNEWISKAQEVLDSLSWKSNEIAKDLLSNAKDAISDVIWKIKNNFTKEEQLAFKEIMESGEAKVAELQSELNKIEIEIASIKKSIEDPEIKTNWNLDTAQIIKWSQIPDFFSAPDKGGIAIIPAWDKIIMVPAKAWSGFSKNEPMNIQMMKGESILDTLNRAKHEGVKCREMMVDWDVLKIR